MDYDAVIFDFDETIVDSFKVRLSGLRLALKEHLHQDLDEDGARALIRRFSNIESQAGHLTSDEETRSKIIQTYRQYIFGAGRRELELFEGMEALISGLSRRVRLALVTSRFRDVPYGDARWGVAHDLEWLGLASAFKVIVGFEDTAEHKPSPEPYLRCLAMVGLPAESALALGDSALDIQAAKAAGLRTIGALWGAVDRGALLASRPDIAFERPGDMLDFLVGRVPG